jgi:hypothetical protein
MKLAVKQSHQFHPQLLLGPVRPNLDEVVEWVINHFHVDEVLAGQIIEVGGEARSNIPKAEILRLIEWAELKSDNDTVKLCVIWNADLLSTITQNSLLKFIEEPPANVVIIINAKSTSNLLRTLRSRVGEVRWAGIASRESGDVEQAEKFIRANYLERVKMVDRWEREQLLELLQTLQTQPTALKKNVAAVAKATAALKHNASVKLTSLYLAISMDDKN